MADRSRPCLASITIRRLVLPPGEARQATGDAIAAAIAGELDPSRPSEAPEASVARAIARSIASHPGLAAAGLSTRETNDGRS